MNPNEFMEVFEALKRLYEKKLTEEQDLEYYKEFKDLKPSQFKYLCGEATRNCKYFPKIADLVAIRKTIKFQQDKNKAPTKTPCVICNSTGVIRYYRKINDIEYEYVARCICDNANEFKAYGKLSDEFYRKLKEVKLNGKYQEK